MAGVAIVHIAKSRNIFSVHYFEKKCFLTTVQ